MVCNQRLSESYCAFFLICKLESFDKNLKATFQMYPLDLESAKASSLHKISPLPSDFSSVAI